MDGQALKIGAILLITVILIVIFVLNRKKAKKLERDIIESIERSNKQANQLLQQYLDELSGKKASTDTDSDSDADTDTVTGTESVSESESESEIEIEIEIDTEIKIPKETRKAITQKLRSNKNYVSKTEDKNNPLNIVYINFYGKIQNFSCDPSSINQSSPNSEWVSLIPSEGEGTRINLNKQFIINIDDVEAAFSSRLKKQIAAQRKQFEKEKREKENSITITYKSKSYEESRRFYMPEFNLHLSSIIKKRTSPDFISAITLDDPKREAKRLMFRIKKIESIVIHKENTRLVKPKEIAQFLQKNAQQK